LVEGGRGASPYLSIILYHEINAAARIIMMAQRANGDLRKQAVGSLGEQEMAGERQERLEQKISSECFLHTIAGHNTGNLNLGPPRGTNDP
jgi:hypothetical protein